MNLSQNRNQKIKLHLVMGTWQALPLLDDKIIKNTQLKEKRYEPKDTNGLVFDLMLKGVRTWRFRCSYKNKDYKLTLGEYPLISLEETRETRDEAKARCTKGENPAKNHSTPTTFGKLFEGFKNTKLKPLLQVYVASYEERVKNHISPHHKNTSVVARI